MLRTAENVTVIYELQSTGVPNPSMSDVLLYHHCYVYHISRLNNFFHFPVKQINLTFQHCFGDTVKKKNHLTKKPSTDHSFSEQHFKIVWCISVWFWNALFKSVFHVISHFCYFNPHCRAILEYTKLIPFGRYWNGSWGAWVHSVHCHEPWVHETWLGLVQSNWSRSTQCEHT